MKWKNQIGIGLLLAAALVFTFWWGGNAPSINGMATQNAVATAPPVPENTSQPPLKSEPTVSAKPSAAAAVSETPVTASQETPEAVTSAETENAWIQPAPIDPENVQISKQEQTCTLSVRCDTILKNMAWLKTEKAELVPEDGILFAEQEVTFYEGESVFNLLSREMKRNKIHLEFVNTPMYNSVYIEGIGNLYEFDCGELSGWMYRVNGWFPNYGCSRYQLKEGDKVELVFTCDLGKDVGGDYAAQNGRQEENE